MTNKWNWAKDALEFLNRASLNGRESPVMVEVQKIITELAEGRTLILPAEMLRELQQKAEAYEHLQQAQAPEKQPLEG